MILQDGPQTPGRRSAYYCWFVVKDATQGQPNGRAAQDKGWGGGETWSRRARPGHTPSQSPDVPPSPETLQILLFGGVSFPFLIKV